MKEKFLNWVKLYWHWLIIAPLAVLFFLGTSSLNYFTQSYNVDSKGTDFVKWASPDENANYIFAKLYAQTGQISFYEKYNAIAADIIKPRSFRSDLGTIKPMSFLGIIILYGKIASVTTYKIIPYLTPFFAALGLIYYYLFIKKIFNGNNALMSVIMLSFFPPYVYFSARSMFHNVLFTSLLIIALYYGYIMIEKRKDKIGWLYAALSGFIFGLVITARTSELLWLGPILLLIWIFNIRKIGITKLIIFLSCLLIATIPVFYFNKVLYGSYILGGYAEMNRSIINIKDASAGLLKTNLAGEGGQASLLLTKIRDSVFFFGFNTYKSAKMFYYYFVDMFPWLFWPALLGGIIFILRWYKLKYRHLVYLVSLMVVSTILIFYYGSWEFHDNPNVNEHTLGNSYTRYWLPIYLGVIPFASVFFLRFTRILSKLLKPISYYGTAEFFSFKFSQNFSKLILRTAIIIPLIILSIHFVLFGSSEGLYFLGQRQIDARKEWQSVLDHTEKNSIIITQYHDKLLFPERKVVVGLFDDPNMIKEYAKLALLQPTYYYNFTFPDKTFDYLNRSRLFDANLQIEKISAITKDFTLYKLNYEDRHASSTTASSTGIARL